MSFISTLYDLIYSTITTTFPTKTELKNPVDIRDNHDLQLINGFGIQVLGLSNTNEVEQRLKVFERTFNITLTKKAIKTEMENTSRRNAEKSLLEDQNTLIQALLDNKTIVTRVVDYQVTDDDGIDFIFEDQKNFMMIKTRVVVKYYLNTTY